MKNGAIGKPDRSSRFMTPTVHTTLWATRRAPLFWCARILWAKRPNCTSRPEVVKVRYERSCYLLGASVAQLLATAPTPG